jgi:hypothetical protein
MRVVTGGLRIAGRPEKKSAASADPQWDRPVRRPNTARQCRHEMLISVLASHYPLSASHFL